MPVAARTRPRPGTGRAADALPPRSCRPRSTSSGDSTTRRAPTRRALVRRTPAAQAVPGAAAGRRRARGRLRAVSRARAAHRVQRSADEGRDARVARRARTIACARSRYSFFEHNPDPSMVPELLAALEKEQAEFVRPALIRALAALRRRSARPAGARPRGRRAARTSSAARSSKRSATTRRSTRSTRSRRSPSSTVRCRTMRRWRWGRSATSARSRRCAAICSARRPRPTQPSIAAAICLLGVNCESHENYLIETLKFADKNIGFQELLRGAAAGLGALAVGGHADSGRRRCSTSASRRAIRPARRWRSRSATVALRNTPLMLAMLEKRAGSRRRDCAARRRVRHARRGSRQGAVLRPGAPHVLGSAGEARRRAR